MANTGLYITGLSSGEGGSSVHYHGAGPRVEHRWQPAQWLAHSRPKRQTGICRVQGCVSGVILERLPASPTHLQFLDSQFCRTTLVAIAPGFFRTSRPTPCPCQVTTADRPGNGRHIRFGHSRRSLAVEHVQQSPSDTPALSGETMIRFVVGGGGGTSWALTGLSHSETAHGEITAQVCEDACCRKLGDRTISSIPDIITQIYTIFSQRMFS
jgi:hypothetical protein